MSEEKPYIEIIETDRKRKVILPKRVISIGRSADNDLPISEERASRRHCTFEKTTKGFLLTDNGSTNGTKVNGDKINKVLLVHGDEVLIGQTRILFFDPLSPAAIKAEKKKKQNKAFAEHNPLAGAEPFELPDMDHGDDDPSMFVPPRESKEVPVEAIERLLNYGHEKELKLSQITLKNARGKTVHEASELAGTGDDEHLGEAISIFRLLIAAGFKTKGSDLHFEPHSNTGSVRIRVDGTMIDAMTIANEQFKRMLNMVKILCDIDITQRESIQEGHFSSVIPSRTVDYRVSFTPSVHGQKLVVRILDSSSAPQKLEQLCLPDWMLRVIATVSQQTAGMVLVCGPTGSGKTTTLYTVLRDIDRTQRNVITIEDPVEYQIDGVTHIPCNEAAGNTFHSLLRSVLRQDPDVILLGEIRDKETAQTAMQAAMTGHLVLSTVHAKDTIGTIFRLLDLGCEPFLLGSSLNLVLAQRLIRQLCDNCRAPKRPTPSQIGLMGRAGREVKSIYYPVGCLKCLNVGYAGRRGLFELLAVNDALRDAILNSPTISTIRDALKRTVFTSLAEAGWNMVAKGITSSEEVERMVGTA